MHPVTSDLDFSIRQYERDLELQSIRRESIAMESARIAGRPGLVARLIQAARRSFDPRGYALDQALRINVPARRTPKVAAPVETFPEPSGDDLRKAA